MAYAEKEIQESLDELVDEGELHRITMKDGTSEYVANTFKAGFEYALKEEVKCNSQS